MDISELMHSPAITVGPDSPLADALTLMVANSVTELPVVNDDEELIGILGEADLYRARLSNDQTHSLHAAAVQPYAGRVVRDLMRRPVISVRITETLRLCQLKLMGLARTLPVMDGVKVVGLISRRDLLAAFAKADAGTRQQATAVVVPKTTGVEYRVVALDPERSSAARDRSVEPGTMAQQVTVAMIMSRPVLTVTPEQSLADAWVLMSSCGVRHVAVTAGEHCVGVIDDRQLVAAWPQGPSAMQATTAGHLLGRRVAGVLADASLSEAAAIMKADGVDAVPVVDQHGALVGLVTAVDLIRAVARWGIDAGATRTPDQPPSMSVLESAEAGGGSPNAAAHNGLVGSNAAG